MDLRAHLLDTFRFTDQANRKLLARIAEAPDKAEPVRFFSHLINCQVKWMARVAQDPEQTKLDWWTPVHALDELEARWTKSLSPWLAYLERTSEEELEREVTFIGFDGSRFAATPKDIALQLNYHSIHHRAQIQTMLRQQGVAPDFVDYIGTRYRRVGAG